MEKESIPQQDIAKISKKPNKTLITFLIFLLILTTGTAIYFAYQTVQIKKQLISFKNKFSQKSPTPTAPNAPTVTKSYTKLISKATNEGSVSVIVSLNLSTGPFIPEGNLSDIEMQKQRQTIITARQALLNSLSDDHTEVYASWDSVPQIAIKVDLEGLKQLVSSPYVSAIHEDTPSHLYRESSTEDLLQTKDKPRDLDNPTGYIEKVYQQNNQWYSDINYIKLYFGDKDKEEAVKDDVCTSINQCSWPNNFALRDLDEILTTHQISHNAKIDLSGLEPYRKVWSEELQDFTPLFKTNPSIAEFSQYFDNQSPSNLKYQAFSLLPYLKPRT